MMHGGWGVRLRDSSWEADVTKLWRRTLRRRSQKDWTTKERTARLANNWLPRPRIFTPGQMRALQSGTQGGSRMPESGP